MIQKIEAPTQFRLPLVCLVEDCHFRIVLKTTEPDGGKTKSTLPYTGRKMSVINNRSINRSKI